MTTENLLVELGTEELPPKALPKLASAFAAAFEAGLKDAGLVFENVNWLASPRRLAIQVSALAHAQPDRVEDKRGPSVSAAFDADGNPTKAAQGWARGNGITVDQASRLKTDKGEWLLHRAEIKGKDVASLLPDLVQKAVKQIPIPKAMRWGAYDTEFIRPVHTFTLLYGDTLIDAEVLGKRSGLQVQGHRFHSEGLISIAHADEYETLLETQGRVIASFERRRNIIKQQVKAVAAQEGGVADIDADLLDEVTALVEWPVTLVGSFENDFLVVPKEALIYTMKDNQKYFPVLDRSGELMSRFIFVSNIESKDPSQVVSGNEKVIRPRLADARFFLETDSKKTLESRVESLGTVLFQKQLGTLKDKAERVAKLAGYIAAQLGGNETDALRAGLLSKTDLMTEMVMEFPDVQGVMGMHYARNDGETEAVAIALNEQYMPRYSGDQLPSTEVGCALAIAEKIDTLVGIFGIGQAPKGDKDPFALRRAAIGSLRILVEKSLPLDIADLAHQAQSNFGPHQLTNANVVDDVVDFTLGRFRTWYEDQSVSVDVIQAVLAKRPTEPSDFDARIKAVSHFRTLSQSSDLAAANKRVGNILAKIEGQLLTSIDTSLLTEPAEIALYNAFTEAQLKLKPLFADSNYQQALTELATLNEVINAFFDEVMVNADDTAVRQNRQALLNQLHQAFLHTADISLLQQ
ncbi:glycine--tRNA ligase subunit beta [Echinimonas agarilytica]|uniref:Glycine--tRNA ligase beta subunit n=1 Tax=Echinimonas agarilytica TaxID=1215918 RepID=A0AA41W3A4_9GAMM|nr:glycine--tRNA ligase subunit beta [Echinimonas agarilytica]MCM2678077.1 glycine--tRNA ligase subunit beta [Echinimonas agarilytica]